MPNARARVGLILLLLSALWLSGCATVRERSLKVTDDWSRGLRVGEASLRQPVGLAVDDQGAYLIWSARQEEGTRLTYARLTPQGLLAHRGVVDLAVFFPRLPHLVAAQELEAFVITRLDAGEKDGVYHFRLDRDGNLLARPQRLSAAEQRSEHVVVAQAPDGAIDVLWDVVDGPSTGVFHLRMNASGSAEGFPQLMGPGGHGPSGQVDRQGTLHATWLVESQPGAFDLFYTTKAPESPVGEEPVAVASVRIPSTDIAKPLSLGLDRDQVHILWSQEHRTGLDQGNAEILMVSFPQGRPALTAPVDVLVSENPSPDYVPVEAFPPLTSVVMPTNQVDWSSFVEAPTVLMGNQSDMVTALADATMAFRFDPRPQLLLLVFQDGKFIGHQHITRTRQYSQLPSGAVDADGQFHIAWVDLESPGSYSVYYASTDPTVRAELDRRTTNDVLLGAVETAWGMASGLSFLPLVFVVLLPVLLICAAYYFTGSDDSLRGNWMSQLTLGVSTIVYLGLKILVFAGLILRPPFLRIVPEVLQPVWVWIAVLLVAVAAGLVTWMYIRRNDRPILFRAALTFALADSLLTLLIYGPSFYGE